MCNNTPELKITALKEKGCIPGLEPEIAVCRFFSDPQNKIKTIHIAGTNGKGSTGYFIQNILILCGFKVGRYSSPAVSEKYEVININGEYITENDYLSYTNRVINEAEKNNISITEFEAETAAAFLYFKEKQVDFAIIECGMGGLSDATNVINSPDVSVITTISIDHTAFLGKTISEIAKQKCGIIKQNCPVCVGVGTYDSLDIIKQTAKGKNSKLYIADKNKIKISDQTINGQTFSYKSYENLFTDLIGTYQPENAALALEVFDVLKEKYNINADIKNAFLKNNVLFGRFTILNKSPLIIADGAHNEGAAKKLSENIEKYFKNKKICLIFGTFKDKEYLKCADIIFPYAYKIYTVDAYGKRAVPSKELALQLSEKYNNVTYCKEYLSAVLSAMADKPDVIISFGSLSYLRFIKSCCDELFSGGLKRISEILLNKKFIHYMNLIDKYEKDRIFCKHSFEHLVKTAEICYNLSCEYNIDEKKDIIFAAAFMHDLGRAYEYKDGISHEEHSIRISKEILSECEFNQSEIQKICETIGSHRKKCGNPDTFSDIFYLADKFSRNCPECLAYDDCYWSIKDKSHTTKYI